MRLLGLDVGERRIGVAVSDPTGTIARPLHALERASRKDD
ncbi:MAG: RuvX/YqgF family protein, partial [Anaerolineae bacterium]